MKEQDTSYNTLDQLPVDRYEPWGCISYTVITAILMTAIFLSLLTSCTTKQIVSDKNNVEVITTHDTLREYHITHDSIYYRDSIYTNTYTQGDTVYQVTNKVQIQYRDRIKHDTINNPVIQTRHVMQTATTEIEKQTFWDKLGIVAAILCFLSICIFLCIQWWAATRK